LTSASLPHIFFKKMKKEEDKVRASYGENRRKQEKTGIGRPLADHWQTIGRRLPDISTIKLAFFSVQLSRKREEKRREEKRREEKRREVI
jgi:hypothetical protein